MSEKMSGTREMPSEVIQIAERMNQLAPKDVLTTSTLSRFWFAGSWV